MTVGTWSDSQSFDIYFIQLKELSFPVIKINDWNSLSQKVVFRVVVLEMESQFFPEPIKTPDTMSIRTWTKDSPKENKWRPPGTTMGLWRVLIFWLIPKDHNQSDRARLWPRPELLVSDKWYILTLNLALSTLRNFSKSFTQTPSPCG